MSLNVAIIGAGWMGETHARAVLRNGDRVTRVIDRDEARALALAEKVGATAATDLAAARDCGAAVIATPSADHLAQSETLARLGLHLLIEKPHRFPTEDASRLRRTVADKGLYVQIGMTTRFHPGIQALQEAVEAGRLGKIHAYADRYWFTLAPDTLPDWYFHRETAGGGVVLTNGVHMLDRCRWILGEDLVLDRADMARIIPGHQVEDHGELRLHGSHSNTPVSVSLLWSDRKVPDSELTVVGSQGVALIGAREWRIDTRVGTVRGSAPDQDTPFEAQWAAFAAQCARPDSGRGGVATLDELETTLTLIERIYQQGGGSK